MICLVPRRPEIFATFCNICHSLKAEKESLFSHNTGWYPELVFLIVVLFNSTVLTRVFPNSSVLWKVFHGIAIPKNI